MPSKKKKYNARFPAGRIKKIMQTDEEVGKVAQAVPVIISRTLELFVESLLKKSMHITQARSAKTLTPSHMKQCILSESRFDFLKDLVKNIPDASVQEDNENNAIFEENTKLEDDDANMDDPPPVPESRSKDVAANFYNEQCSSTSRTPVIQFAHNVASATAPEATTKFSFSVNSLLKPDSNESKLHIKIESEELPAHPGNNLPSNPMPAKVPSDSVPPLIPIAHNFYNPNASDNLCIDEDYDN